MTFSVRLETSSRRTSSVSGNSTFKSPEIVAAYADALLRVSNPHRLSGESEREDALQKVATMFQYIDDKYIFLDVYTARLSRRLVHNASVSFDAEDSMTNKLQGICGFLPVAGVYRVLADMGISIEITRQFNELSTFPTSETIGFDIKVLGSNYWPLKASMHDFVIPRQILPIFTRFTRFYQDKPNARKLTWLWNHSKKELHTNYLSQRYILLTSTQQMASLLQFNTNDALSLGELTKYTGIPEECIAQTLVPLVRARILISEDRYYLNLNFQSKKVCVNPCAMELKEVDPAIIKAAKDRQWLVDNSTFRVVKLHKVIKHQALIKEVLSKVSGSFTPKIAEIKKAIEMLIDKEYMERDETQPDTYGFIA